MDHSLEVLPLLIRTAHTVDSKNKAMLTPQQVEMIPPQRRVDKPCAACLILPPDHADHHQSLRTQRMLLGKNPKSSAWEVLGGGLNSLEEMAMDALLMGSQIPGGESFQGSFYHLQAIALLSTGGLRQLSYQTKNGETDEMAALREVVEEGLVKGVKIIHAFDQGMDFCLKFAPSNKNIKPILEKKYPEIYGKNPFAMQRIRQQGYVATTAEKQPVFQANAEICEIRWFTFGDILEVSLVKALFKGPEELSEELRSLQLRNSIPVRFMKQYIEWLITENVSWNW